ncbi:hypothetical protein [Ligilactobacillus salivarius]|uniref:Uncharacterized protein n=3 Tax=Ligilactobacillus salivarius TaxID=1624 RepID=A0JQR7_LIGS1|nr:hypothetical protein [Ligilactobacillus salivarius]ABE00454.1 Hypothetical protein, phage associated [Ligilactobacillus salivarius UCC118]MBC6927063.1 hypothetical protein [Ligilactobacillus salivarius]OQR10262.1 hypothetical protein B6U44_08150 [Ligilactobacillus salivarius]OQR18895.1 hypothetical protein B6U40_08500 [Ligilactobacillus salivarius]
MNKMDIDDRIEIIANQLDSITDLIGFNLTVSDIKKSDELDRLYFLIDYIKQITTDLKKISDDISIKDDAK